ncbi:MAG: peptidoglycan-binding protein [Roseovarius sp.]
MKISPLLAVLAATSLLGACQAGLPRMAEPAEVVARDAPPGAQPGTCWGQDETPAVIETVTEQVVVQPAGLATDGASGTPAVYETETQQKIVKPRKATWFETPCEHQLTPEFNTSLQRALKARGHYRGPINGEMDGRTRAAIRAYQKPQGLDSAKISLAAARQMGLSPVELPGEKEKRLAAAEQAEKARKAEEARIAAEAATLRKEAEQMARLEAEKEEDARREAERQAKAVAKAEAEAKRETERLAAIEAEKAAQAQREAEAQAREKAEQAEKAKRAAELKAALEDEKKRNDGQLTPLPISTESN